MRDPLFAAIKIGGLTVKNRIYLPAMHLGMCVDFMVTDQMVDFYVERAKGGAAMIVVGNATVDDMSGNSQYIGAHLDDHLPGLAKLASAIRENGARAAVQLNHAGRYNHSFFMDGKQAVAPSAIASKLTREVPRELTTREIEEIVKSFAAAAERVKKAGFDAVEVLCGTGYLISEFLSPLTNHRKDEYGGSLENRMRFGLEIIGAIRQKVGEAFPVIVRMDHNDFMAGGQDRSEFKVYAKQLVAAGVDALCVKGSWHEARVPQLTSNVPKGMYAYLAKGIRDVVDVPVIASHRINDPATARQLLEEGMCDMVAMARSLIADPYLPEKAKEGREKEIVHCIGCAQGCFDNLFQLKFVECMCNPRAGHEGPRKITKAPVAKKVMVVGGGAGGMSAALAAAESGHDVTLYERSEGLGGQLHLAAAPPGRTEFLALAKDLETQVGLSGVTVRRKTPVDEALIRSEAPDAVIIATGAEPLTPPISGVDGPNVVQAWDVLLDRAQTGKRVVVIGGGAVGVETALALAEKGTLPAEAVKFLVVNRAESPEEIYRLATEGTKEVTVIEMIDRIGKDIGKSTKWVMMQDLGRSGVELRAATTAVAITENGVIVEKKGEREEIPADTVVIAAGSKPLNPLQPLLESSGIACSVIGDAGRIALAFDAVHEGYEAGRKL